MRTFTTKDITDIDVSQIIITRNDSGIRIRATATVTLVDSVDPKRTTTMNLNLNKTAAELGVGAVVVGLRNAVLAELKNQLL